MPWSSFVLVIAMQQNELDLAAAPPTKANLSRYENHGSSRAERPPNQSSSLGGSQDMTRFIIYSFFLVWTMLVHLPCWLFQAPCPCWVNCTRWRVLLLWHVLPLLQKHHQSCHLGWAMSITHSCSNPVWFAGLVGKHPSLLGAATHWFQMMAALRSIKNYCSPAVVWLRDQGRINNRCDSKGGKHSYEFLLCSHCDQTRQLKPHFVLRRWQH